MEEEANFGKIQLVDTQLYPFDAAVYGEHTNIKLVEKANEDLT